MRVSKPVIGVFATFLFVLLSMQSFAQGTSGPADVTGEVAVEIADFFEEGRSETYYFIVDKQSNARTQVFFPGSPDEAFTSGARVRIQGTSRGKNMGVDVESIEVLQLAPDRLGAAPAIDDASPEAVQATPQTRKVLTLIVNFLDAVVDTGTANAVTPLIVSNQMFNDPQNIQHFYDKASLGTLTIPTDPNSIGKEAIFGPYTINYNYLVANGGTCDANGWAQAALAAWEADGVGNPSSEKKEDYDSWSIIVPNYWDYSGRACSWGGYAGVGCTQCWAFSADPASILFGVVIHELGHNFGFGHADSDTDNDGLNICGYCDSSDLMGGDREWMKFNAPHADFQGWWDDVTYIIETITPASTEQQFDLIPMDEEETLWPGMRAVKTTRTINTNYYFSYRQQTGHYNDVNTPYTTGVNIHWGYSSLSNNYKTNFIRTLEAGQVFQDPTQDLIVWGVGPTLVDDGQGNTTNVFTIKVCNSTCATLWPALSLSAAGASPATIQLSWEDFTYNEDGFTIEYSPDGSAWSTLDTVAADTTSYAHSGLTGGSTFYYRVRAYRGAGETSDWSNTASATTPPASGTLGLNIETSDDDVIEVTSSGSMWMNGRSLYLDYDSWNDRQNDEGIRFRNIPIPQGSVINSAYIEYRAYNAGTGTNTITFRTENVDDAAIFTSASNSVSSRSLLMTASVDWTLSDWGGGSIKQSPDLSSIIQPIINRAGWAGGNSMVFVTESDYSGSHVVYSYDGSQYYGHGNTYSPKLVIDYTWTPPGNQTPTASFTFSCNDLDCSFTDTSTDADGSIASWSWDFGDTGTSTAQNPLHSYAAYGNYSVSLTVTDDEGDPDTVIVPVVVQQVNRGPYLQTLTESSVIVRWRTELATDSVVRYGLAAGALSSTTTVAGSTTEHTVVLSGLSPLTEYFYSIGDSGDTFAGDASFHFTTSPTPGTSVPTRFWVIGDSGTANANAEAVRDRYKEYADVTGPSDFMLMLGDNAYNSGTDEEYQAAVFETYPELLRQLPVWPTLGNHDGYSAYSATQTGPYYDIFDLPTTGEAGGLPSGTEAYYSFDYGDTHFIVLDSYDTDRSASGVMMTWLESDLATNDKPWLIAFWHHPPYTKGSHDSDTEGELIDMRQNALPLLESWGVDLVLCGHSHSYERSMLLDGHYGVSTTLDVPTMVLNAGDGKESGLGAYEKPSIIAAMNEGAVYAVAGSSGKISGGSLDHPVMYVSINVLGSMVIDVNDTRLDAVFIDNLGALRDEFTILKTADTDAPLLLSASAEDGTHVLVEFNETLDLVSAETASNYAIGGVSISAAELLTGRTVRLTTSSLTTGGYYLLTVNNIEDGNGNSVAPNSQAGFYFNLPVTVDFQPANFDASFREANPDTNYGSLEYLEVDGDTTKHILLGWDISSIPANAVIDTATMHLTTFDPSTGSFTCNAMLSDWVESEVTWNNAKTGVPWATPGATGAADRGTDVLCDTFSAGTNGPLTINLNSLGIAQVQSWVDGTDTTNYGFMLGNPSSTDGADFRSSEYATEAERPRLEVTYSFPIPVPVDPTVLGATAVSPTQINLGWTDNSINETGFKIERSPDGSTGWSNIASLGLNVTTYADTGLSPETTYYYRVYAQNHSGDSSFTNVANATTLAVPLIDPVASFSYNCINLGCTFSDLSTDSDGSVVAWLWDFGDGNTSSAQNPTHQFLAANTYTVTLTVTDNDDATDNTSSAVTVTTPNLHAGVVNNVSSSAWTTVNLPQNYTSMVVVGSPNYGDTHVPAVVRINNVTANSFDVRVANPSGVAISGVPVHYVVVEEGVYTAAANGITMEAVKVTSTVTDRKSSWAGQSQSYTNSYTSPAVLGQVMSYNDVDWSVFWARGSSKNAPPSASSLLTGKHVAGDTNTTRSNETIGYIVIETGSGTIGGIEYAAAAGGDIVEGVTSANPSPPYNYSIATPATPNVAVVSSAAMDDNDGGWPLLYGANPVVAGTLALAIDEDQVADTERAHSSEQVAYMVFNVPQAPCSASMPLPADQWIFFSLPCAPVDAKVSAVFNGGPAAGDYSSRWIVYHYDATTAAWVQIGVDDTLVEGKGYIYYSLDAFASVEVSGELNTGAAIPLAKATDTEAWNLIGNPYNNPVNWTSVSVDDGTTTYSWSEMDQQVDPDPYYCEQTPTVDPDCIMWHVMNKWETNVYVPYDGQGDDPGTLGVFETMWVRSHRADTITLTDPAAAPPAEMLAAARAETPITLAGADGAETPTTKTKISSRATKTPKTKTTEWDVRLVIEADSYGDDGNWLGQVDNARNGLDSRDLEEWTPYSSPYLSILFTNPLFDEVDWGYTRDYRESTRKQRGEWTFVVRASAGISDATLSWESNTVSFKKVSLIDEVSGEVIKVKAGGTYTFEINEGEHPFRIIFE